MQLKFEKFHFADGDHCKLVQTSHEDYEADSDCPSCLGSLKPIVTITNGAQTGLTTGLCTGCGFIKRIKNLKKNILERHFSSEWLKDRKFKMENVYGVYFYLEPFLKPGMKILDLGCGDGSSMMPFFQKKYSIRGVDPSKIRSQMARDYYGNIVETAFAEDYLQNTTETFDIIYSENVLQFAVDPFKILNLAADKLNDGGILYLRAQQFNYSDFAFFSIIGVVRSFLNLHCLKGFIEKHGMKILYNNNTPFVLTLEKNRINNNTRRILNSYVKTGDVDIKKKIKKDFLGFKSRFTSKISIHNKSMNRTMNFKILKRDEIFPVTIYSNDEFLPILLK